MKDSLLLCALLRVTILLGPATTLWAQAGSSLAHLNGTVHDTTNATVSRAAITLREVNTNQVHSTTSNDLRSYVAADLPPGQYELTAEAAAFTKVVISGIVLRVGQVATIDVELTVEAHREQLLVD